MSLTSVVMRLVPFQFRVEAETKPSPVTVIVRLEPPSFAFGGVMDEMLGNGLGVPPPELPPPELLPDEQPTNDMRPATTVRIKQDREVISHPRGLFDS